MIEDFYLYVNKKKVPVPKDVYYAYKRSVWRERKRKEAQADKECSLDALITCGMEIPSTDESLEELIEYKQLLAALLVLLEELADDERDLIDALFYQMQSEREVSQKEGVPQQTIHWRKTAILKKLKRLLRM